MGSKEIWMRNKSMDQLIKKLRNFFLKYWDDSILDDTGHMSLGSWI
jgi:hypothetical protein